MASMLRVTGFLVLSAALSISLTAQTGSGGRGGSGGLGASDVPGAIAGRVTDSAATAAGITSRSTRWASGCSSRARRA